MIIKPSFRMRDDLHILRKLWHIGIGILGLLFYALSAVDQIQMAKTLLIFSLIAFLTEFTRFRVVKLNNTLLKIMGPLMRESERNGFSGLPYYALGVSLSLLLYEEKIAILSILFLVFSDPISSFFGILLGRDKILPNKSLQGAIAGFVTCYLTTLFYLRYYDYESLNALSFAIIAGLIGTISELMSVLIDDNLTIPVFSGLGLTILNKLFLIF